MALLPVVVLRAGTLAESDTFWQVRTGLLIVSERTLPRVDSFSWTVAGGPWLPNSWGFDVVLALAHRAGGLQGVAVAAAVMAWGVLGLALLLARRLGASPAIACGLVLGSATFLIGWLSARPQVVDYAAVLCLILLLRGIASGRHPALRVTGVLLLSVLWANLHAAVALGAAIAATSAVLHVVVGPRRVAIPLAAAAVGAALASLATPYGIELVEHAAEVRTASAGIVDEWAGVDLTQVGQGAVLAVGVVALALAARRGELVIVAALGVTAVGSLVAVRLLPVLLLLAAPMLAAAASAPRVLTYVRSRRVVLVPAAVLCVTVLWVVALPAVRHVGRPDPALYSPGVAERIPTGCAVYTSYLLGGYLILARPDVRVSIDSRNDLYGAPAVLAAGEVVSGESDPTEALAGAGCVVVPSSSGLASRLADSPHWRSRARDASVVLLVRR